jgi:hypothetical protein
LGSGVRCEDNAIGSIGGDLRFTFGSVTTMAKAASGGAAFVFSTGPATSAKQHAAGAIVHQ